MYAALLTVHVLYLRYFIEVLPERNFDFDADTSRYLSDWLGYFIVGVTIIVVAVPEGLPLAVMISLAYSVRKMLIDKNFVKRLASCEIMGGANNICSDKTGTLTMNKMTVTNIWSGTEIQLNINEDVFKFESYFNNTNASSLLTQGICCNTEGTINDAVATEIAMLQMVEKFGVSYEDMRKQHVPPKTKVRFHFTSKRKRMSTILENIPDTETGYDKRVHLKGAAEYVLNSCSHYLNKDGLKVEL